MAPSLVYIGINGYVIALDCATGQEIWRTALNPGDFINVAVADDSIYATTKGELFCLDPATGRLRWQNQLKGLGRGLVTIAGSNGQQTIVMRQKKKRDDEAAASAAG
jgi:outer membrane protein assembly factor BamB